MPAFRKARIALADGRIFAGYSFAAEGESCGEVVFNTSMTGYQEIFTDPSYRGQIVTLTYPLIGNYGVNSEDREAAKPSLSGVIIKELSGVASNWRSQNTLSSYLKENGVIGIEGVDTRALTRHIRLEGAMKAVISTQDLATDSLIAKVRNSPDIIGRDLVKEVSTLKPYQWNADGKYRVVVIDCGVKFNILNLLRTSACQVNVVPYTTSASEILRMQPDGLVLSNGPGDPRAVKGLVEVVRQLLDKVPIFGICLGHQILGLALGAKVYKLKFGHHGANHPVKDLRSGNVAITSQNHGFCVDAETLDLKQVEITHINLNDNTLEGVRLRNRPVMSQQFHPEAGPGPNDAVYLFTEFARMMEKRYA